MEVSTPGFCDDEQKRSFGYACSYIEAMWLMATSRLDNTIVIYRTLVAFLKMP